MDSQTESPEEPGGLSRRHALGLLGTAGAGAVAVPMLGAGTAEAATPIGAPAFSLTPDAAGAPPVQGLHLTFGADPSSQMVVSWITDGAVDKPQVHYGTLKDGFGSSAAAQTRSYVDGKSGRTVFVHHAALNRLRPATDYVYLVSHRGTTPDSGNFRTAPRGRAPLTFTSFGDQATPEVTWTATGPVGLDANSTPASKDIVAGIEQVAPLFHLLNGDLCYANLDVDRVRTWNNFFTNNTRSARFRPWMPAAGNHEIESANGPIGLGAYQAYFSLPSTETDAELAGLYYAFTAGSVRVIVLQNDDNCLQDGGDIYISGYSGGRQLSFLERELKAARASREIDWIVVAMHQVMISSSDANGADLGLRQKYGPLFDRYGVDLVLCGHDHDYERSWPVRGCNHHVGRDATTGAAVDTCQPQPVVTTEPTEGRFDTSHGTIHLILGGGGTSAPLDAYGINPRNGLPQAKVITKANRPVPGPTAGVFVKPAADAVEDAIWSARRDTATGYGVAVFDLDPGVPNGKTSITMRYYHAVGADRTPTSDYEIFDTLVLAKERRDTKTR